MVDDESPAGLAALYALACLAMLIVMAVGLVTL